MTTVLTGLVD